MQAAELVGAGHFQIVDLPVPQPGPGEVLLKVTAVGLCGSDLHSYRDGNIGGIPIPNGYILGHEFAGEVVALGEGVTNRYVGQRLAVDPAVPCEHCEFCHMGHPNLCANLIFVGTPPYDGALREFMTHPARATDPIPDSLSAVEGALLEPLGVALHALDLAKIVMGETVAILGCGSIGLMMLQLAKMAGASRILAIDKLDYRLEMAERLGATEAVQIIEGQTPDIESVQVVLEATGSGQAMTYAVDLARPGGRVIYVGIPDTNEVVFRASTARRKGLTLKLSRRMKYMYHRTIPLVESKKVDLLSMVTHRFPLAETAQAFNVFSNRLDCSIKVAVVSDEPGA